MIETLPVRDQLVTLWQTTVKGQPGVFSFKD